LSFGIFARRGEKYSCYVFQTTSQPTTRKDGKMPEPTLYERYLELKKQGVHQRDAVARLGVSEGGLVAAFPETQ